MAWVKFALLLLSIADKLFDYARERKYISEGQDREIAEANARILQKTQHARTVLANFHAMSDTDLDNFLRQLETDRHR